jgi:hypothetical protein
MEVTVKNLQVQDCPEFDWIQDTADKKQTQTHVENTKQTS